MFILRSGSPSRNVLPFAGRKASPLPPSLRNLIRALAAEVVAEHLAENASEVPPEIQVQPVYVAAHATNNAA